MGLEDETHFVDTSWNPRTLGRGEKVFWKFWYLENYAILNPTQLESSYWSCSQGTKILRMLFSDTNVMIEVPQFVQKKNSFWGVFLFLAGGNANFMWRPNSFRFQALHPSIFRTAANLPIIIIQNVQGLSRKSDFLRPLKPIRGRTSSMMTDGIYKIFSDLRGCRVARWSISPEIWHEI